MRFLVTLLLLALPFAAFAQEEEQGDVGFLAGLIQDNLSGAGRDVRIQGFEGALSSRATIERLTIADAEGVWLVAEDLVLDWNRSALLRRRLEIEELGAGLIRIDRAPIAGEQVDLPQPEATPFSLPDLPVAINIEALAVDRVELGPPLLGEEVALSVIGQVELEDGEGSADIVAQRLDGSEGRFAIAGSYSNETRVLALDVELVEEEGGIVAGLLDLPGSPSVRLAVEGTAPIDDYEAQIALATNGQERLSGAFMLSSRNPEVTEPVESGEPVLRRFALDVSGDVTPLFAPDYAGFFGPEVTLEVAGVQEADGGFRLPEFRLSAESLELAGAVEIGPGGWPERIDIEGTLASVDQRILLPLSGPRTYVDGATLAVTYDQAAGDEWEGALEVFGLERPGLYLPEVTVSGNGVIQSGAGDATGGATLNLAYSASGLGLDDAALAEALGTDLSGTARIVIAEGEPTEVEELTLSGAGLQLAAQGAVGVGEGLTTDLQASVEAEGLERFSGLVGRDLAGAAQLDIAGTVSPLSGAFDLAIEGQTEDLAVGIAEIDPLLAGPGEIALVAQRDEAGTRIETLSVATPELTLDAAVDLSSQAVTGRIAATIEDLSLVSDDLAGSATLSGSAVENDEGETRVVLTADAGGAEFQINATVATEEAGYATRGTIAASVADLSAWSDLLGRPLAGSADLDLAGTVQPLSGGFDVSLTGQTQDLLLGLPQLDPLLAGEGDVAIEAQRGPEGIRISQLVLDTAEVTVEGTADLTGTGATADFNARIEDLGVLSADLSGPATLTGTAEHGDDGFTDVDIQAVAGTAGLDIDALVAPQSEGFLTEGEVQVSVSDLEPWSDLAGRSLNGSADLRIAGTLLPRSRWFDVTATGETRNLVLGVPQLDPLLDGEGAFDISAQYNADGLQVTELAIETPQLTATGSADTTGEGISADLTARIAEMGTIAEGLSGPATLAGSANQNPDGTTDIRIAMAAPSARLGLEGLLGTAENGYPFTGEAEALVSDLAPYGELAGRDLAGSVALAATGTVLPSGDRFDLQVTGTTSDLTLGIPQVDALLRGPGEIALAAQRDADQIRVSELSVETPQLSAEGNALVEDAGIRAEIDARLEDIGLLLDGLSGPATVSGTATQNADGTTDLALTATAPSARIGVEGVLGTAGDGFPFLGEIEAAVTNLAPYGDLAGLDLSGSVTAVAQGTVRPLVPAFDLQVEVEASGVNTGIAPVDDILGGRGEISASVELTEEGTLGVQNLEFATPNLTGSASLSGAQDGATAQFDLRLRDVGIFTPDLSGPLAATGEAELTESGNWRIDADLTGPGGTTAQVAGTVAQGGMLNQDATGRLPLGLLNGVLEPRRISGQAAFDLSIAGPPALSSVSGTVSVDDARVAAPTLAQSLEGVQGQAVLRNGRAQLNFSGDVDGGGSVSVTGGVGLAPPFPADLNVALDSLVLQDPELYRTSADGRITISGPLTGGARIAGQIDLGETEVQVPSSSVGRLGALPDVTHVAPPEDVLRTLARAEVGVNGDVDGDVDDAPGGPNYALDILINAPQQIFIRGRGLDAELGGQLRIAGTTRDVDPVGRFDLIRGRVEILQQRFELTEGYAQLQGDFRPYLRLLATTEARDGTLITVVVEGPATDPEVSFESAPDLPEDEILSRLIFGRDLSSISPLQAVQLASAVSTLAGRGGGVVDDLRQGLGLDDFDVTSTEDGLAALRLGRYLGENVYTNVEIDSEGQTQINLNLDITDDIAAKASFGSEGESGVGVFFERDY